MSITPAAVAVLGLGTMGLPMAANIRMAGIPTVVWNRTPPPAAVLDGPEAVPTASEAVARAGVVVTMVSDVDAVLSIARDHGMLAALAPGAIWVQMSTIGVADTERLIDLVAAERPDVLFVDAPVSGSAEPARNGTLTVLASGPVSARIVLDPLFSAVGERTVWVGEAGAGSRMKLVVNTWLALGAEAVVSSLVLAHRLGLETGTVLATLEGSPLVSAWQGAKLERIADDDFSAQFALSLALKDVRLAVEAAGRNALPTLEALSAEWQGAVAEGYGSQDLTAVLTALDAKNGQTAEVVQRERRTSRDVGAPLDG
ncbi:NAD(P)-dependent oxidoreductase [soil metagenome]